MKPVRLVSSPSLLQAQRLLWWAVGVVGLPLALFGWWVIVQSPSRMDELTRVTGVEMWHEPVGNAVFNQPSLQKLVPQPPDWANVRWQPVTLPSFIELSTSVDLLLRRCTRQRLV